MKLLLFLFLALSLYSVDIDTDLLKDIVAKNPEDVKNRLLLAKYYIKHKDLGKAEKLVLEALKNDQKNKKAKELKKQIQRVKTLKSLLREYGVSDIGDDKELAFLFETLYRAKKYKKLLIFYKLLSSQEIKLPLKAHIVAFRSYSLQKDFEKAREILQNLKDEPLQNELEGDICFYKKEYECAKKFYTKVLKKRYSRHSLSFLLESLYHLNDYGRYKKLYDIVKNRYIDEYNIKKLDKQLLFLREKLLVTLKKEYQKKPDFMRLKAYTTSLYDLKREKEATGVIKDFIKKTPDNTDAKILLSSMLMWQKKYKVVTEILKSVIDNDEALSLYAQALYYKGDYEKCIRYLKLCIKKEQNKETKQELLKKLLFAYHWSRKDKEAKKLLPKVLSFSPHDKAVKELALVLNSDIATQIELFEKKIKKDPKNAQNILKLANLYKKSLNSQKAFKFYKRYYELTKDLDVAKYLAQTLYFKARYKESLPYFEDYLQRKSDDFFVKYQYAITLQNLQDYKKAAKIYKEILNRKNKNYFDIKYRYAFSLLKLKNEKSWTKAGTIFKELLGELEKESKGDKSEKIQELLKFTKNAYKISQREFLKPTRYKDIYLAEGLKKQYQEYNSTKEATNALIAKAKEEKKVKKLLPKTFEQKDNKKNFHIKADYVKDSNGIKSKSVKVSLDKAAKIKNSDIGLYGERFKIEAQKDYNGFKTGLTVKKKGLKLTLGLNSFDDFNDPYASIEYETKIYNHLLNLFLEYQNAVFFDHDPSLIEKRISAVHFKVSDFIQMIEGREFQGEISLLRYKDGNVRFTPSFSLLFLTNSIKNIKNDLFLTGWYQFYSKTNQNYAQNKIDDATNIEFHSTIPITEKISFTPKIAGGYSFKSKSFLYGGAFVFDVRINNVASLVIDCTSNKTKAKKSLSDYNYQECSGDIHYRW